ncbi:MAG: hypothetical protein KAX49_11205 [Halanaerobiales bacterium]|nr:hypothetical protein [Halanaerobiales bacterium]
MIQVDDRVKYKNVLGEWHEGTVLKVNKVTYRIVNNNNFKILSIKKEQVEKLEQAN